MLRRYRPRVNPLNLEAAVQRCVLVCARSRGLVQGLWSQVVSGVVTLGCLSPRPRLRAPVRPYFVRVRARARLERVRACVCVLLGGGVPVVWCAGLPLGSAAVGSGRWLGAGMPLFVLCIVLCIVRSLSFRLSYRLSYLLV